MFAISILIDAINIIFAALGVFVGIETIKARIKEHNEKTPRPSRANISDTVGLENFFKRFPESVKERPVIRSFLESLYSKKRKNVDLAAGNLFNSYKTHLWINLFSFVQFSFIPIVLLIMWPILLVPLAFLIDPAFGAVFMIVGVIVIALEPKGFYRDSAEGNVCLVVGILSGGKCTAMDAHIKEGLNGRLTMVIDIHFNFCGMRLFMYSAFNEMDANSIAHMYEMMRRFFEPERTTLSFENFNVSSNILMPVYFFGFIRTVWIIGDRIRSALFARN